MKEIDKVYEEIVSRGILGEAVVGLAKDEVFFKDYVFLSAESEGNIEVFVQGPEDEILASRIKSMFPRELREKVSIVWDARPSEGKFIPLFDMAIKKADHEIIDHSSGNFKPMRAFQTQKWVGEQFTDEDSLKEFLEGHGEREWVVEQSYDGTRATLHKKGEEIKIFNARGAEITSRYTSIKEQARELSTKDFILDGEIITNGEDKDKDSRYNVFDILYFG